jgi:SAM-dependent methyltransferase
MLAGTSTDKINDEQGCSPFAAVAFDVSFNDVVNASAQPQPQSQPPSPSNSWDDAAARLAADSYAAGSPTAWFDRLYSAGEIGESPLPWDHTEPSAQLRDWGEGVSGHGRRAIVVGCGLGADAAFISGLGFDTVGFDISDAAVRLASSRFPGSRVSFTQADLLDLPAAWRHGFDLVVEVYTVQALPDPPRAQAIANVASLVAPRGSLVVVATARSDAEQDPQGPPWPLTRGEIDSFAATDLSVVRVTEVSDVPRPGMSRWVAEFSASGR